MTHSSSEASLCLGGGECDPGESHEHDVTVYGKSEGRRERVVLDTLPYSSYRVRSTLALELTGSYYDELLYKNHLITVKQLIY